MILLALIFLPLFGGILSYVVGRTNGQFARLVCVSTLAISFLLSILAWPIALSTPQAGPWMLEFSLPWISSIGAEFHLGLDGLSYVLVLLALALSFVGILSISEHPKRHEGLFVFLVMTTLSGVIGVFLAADLLVFFLFWEVMLVPLYFLILLFGEDQRQKAATKFLILTQGSGLFLLLSIIILFVSTEANSLSYANLVEQNLSYATESMVAFGFILAFLVKLPAIPFHFWMPSIFSSAPLSALMAGILIKTSAYGFIRFSKFSFPLFPNIYEACAPYLMVLGIVGMVYGALVAFSQYDIKKILAYSTISHVGFMLAGLFCGNNIAMNGVAILLVTQAISTGGLLMICNHIQSATNTRDISKFSGLFASMPHAGVVTIILVMASVGLPGLGNFVGEWLILMGLFKTNPWLGTLACTGVVLSSVYMLRFLHAIFFGSIKSDVVYRDIPAKSVFLHTLLVVVLVIIGIYPSVVTDTIYPTLLAPNSAFLESTHGKKQGFANLGEEL